MNDGRENVVPITPTPSSGGGGGGSGHGERLARIEAKLEHMARRKDLDEVKTMVESVRTAVESKEARTMRWLAGIVAAEAIAFVAAMIGLVASMIGMATN